MILRRKNFIAGTAAMLLFVFLITIFAAFETPSSISVFPDQVGCIAKAPLRISVNGSTGKATANLFGIIPVKSISVGIVSRRTLVPCGIPFGVKLYTDGVLVVGMSDIETTAGTINPAHRAGIRIGDVLTEMDGVKVLTNEQVSMVFSDNDGKTVKIKGVRDGKVFETQFAPALSKTDNKYRAGLWVRDSTAGIGTITFADPQAGCFGGLGHGICDVDTGSVMPMLKGTVVSASIEGVKKGEKGEPGELLGVFDESVNFGELIGNSDYGIFGKGEKTFSENEALPVASAFEIKEGAAEILSTVEGEEPRRYAIKISRIIRGSGKSSKNMVIEITDKTLLEKTGGIVQGMSGSPIIQNGKLAGAVTHVLVNDPTKGYGIFIENMLAALDEKTHREFKG